VSSRGWNSKHSGRWILSFALDRDLIHVSSKLKDAYSAIFKSSPLVFEEGLNLTVRPAKMEYQAVFLSLKY
jgi:hypothetical protein